MALTLYFEEAIGLGGRKEIQHQFKPEERAQRLGAGGAQLERAGNRAAVAFMGE